MNWFKPWKEYSVYNSLEEGKLELGDEIGDFAALTVAIDGYRGRENG